MRLLDEQQSPRLEDTERTDGDDDSSQESQAESKGEAEGEAGNEAGGALNGRSPSVHEITSDEDDDCVLTHEDSSSDGGGGGGAGATGGGRNGEEARAPIVVSGSRGLAELARAHKPPGGTGAGDEPTVVIIDSKAPPPAPAAVPAPAPARAPPAASAAALCQSIAARGTTITPVSAKSGASPAAPSAAPAAAAPILPSLTDDMFVVEAPSFIVPYVYEKPSVQPFRAFVDALGKQLDEQRPPQPPPPAAADGAPAPAPAGAGDKPGKGRRRRDDDDASWDGESSSSSDEDEDEAAAAPRAPSPPRAPAHPAPPPKKDSYFECSLGRFFMDIGLNLVQEFVQSDLLRQQTRKLQRQRRRHRNTADTEQAIAALSQNLQHSRRLNAPLALPARRCEHCSFVSESALALAHHLEAPHQRGNVYRCNACAFEVRSPHDILFHMEAEHNVRGRLERAPAYQQCANCTFEDNSKSKLGRHLVACAKKFRPEANLAPPLDWEPPAKIPKLTRARAPPPFAPAPRAGAPPMGARAPGLLAPMVRGPRGRPPLPGPRGLPLAGAPVVRGGLMIMHNAGGYGAAAGAPTPPKISITPLPRAPAAGGGAAPAAGPPGKGTFVICEICDGYIKDLEQLRNHMQWIHKVKIHPKMIYNRPPLNCQKCQFRFFTDQGLERHLLGAHGLVTSSMQEAANRGKDAGRCPVCGRVYQWKLLNHVAREHAMALKPAHLSYKCTVCTATFGMYKQFESHVYSAHSVVAKRVMDKGKPTPATPAPAPTPAAAPPIRINDEITIIPQPPAAAAAAADK